MSFLASAPSAGKKDWGLDALRSPPSSNLMTAESGGVMITIGSLLSESCILLWKNKLLFDNLLTLRIIKSTGWNHRANRHEADSRRNPRLPRKASGPPTLVCSHLSTPRDIITILSLHSLMAHLPPHHLFIEQWRLGNYSSILFGPRIPLQQRWKIFYARSKTGGSYSLLATSPPPHETFHHWSSSLLLSHFILFLFFMSQVRHFGQAALSTGCFCRSSHLRHVPWPRYVTKGTSR